MWEIIENLYLGDDLDAQDRDTLEDFGITHILNCAIDAPCRFPRHFESDARPDEGHNRRMGGHMSIFGVKGVVTSVQEDGFWLVEHQKINCIACGTPLESNLPCSVCGTPAVQVGPEGIPTTRRDVFVRNGTGFNRLDFDRLDLRPGDFISAMGGPVPGEGLVFEPFSVTRTRTSPDGSGKETITVSNR